MAAAPDAMTPNAIAKSLAAPARVAEGYAQSLHEGFGIVNRPQNSSVLSRCTIILAVFFSGHDHFSCG
jgi:hypothetical protein